MLLSTWVSPRQLVEDANPTLRSNTCACACMCVYIILVIKGVWELQSFWQGQFGRHGNSAIWQAVPHCLMWCERNARTFVGCEWTRFNLEIHLLRTSSQNVVWVDDGFGDIYFFYFLNFMDFWTQNLVVLFIQYTSRILWWFFWNNKTWFLI